MGKFFGSCNALKAALDECLYQEVRTGGRGRGAALSINLTQPNATLVLFGSTSC